MYSLEDRQRAVDLYFRYGRKASIVIKELGYPDRKMLAKWVKEYRETGCLHEQCICKHRYSEEEKRIAVEFYLRHGKQLSYTMKTLGYPSREFLMKWIDELAPGQRKIFVEPGIKSRYPGVDKKAAVAFLTFREGSAEEVAKDYGVTRSALYNWKKQLADDITVPDMEKKQDGEIKVVSIEEAQEIIRQYEENIARLKEENAALDCDLYMKRIEIAAFEKAAEAVKKTRASVWKRCPKRRRHS